MGISSRSSSATPLGKSVSGIAGRAASFTAGLVFLLVVFIVVVAAIVIGWQHWGRTVVARPVYRIAAENIQVTPAPSWIRSDIRTEVVRDNALSDLSFFDKDVTIRVYQAFELHPWVAKVKRVSKHPPARLEVDLEYRRPVAWVEVPPGILPGNESGVIAIDSSSVVLPTRGNFTEANVDDYLRISIPGITPYGSAGNPWGDPRVAGAARIAALLENLWREKQLFRIRLVLPDERDKATALPSYEIETRGNRRIIWGSAPDANAPHEPTPAAKVTRLQRLAESVGDFDKSQQTQWDLRNS
jgi:hypothetical protein